MKMQTRFGLWLLTLGMSLAKLGMRMVGLSTEALNTDDKISVYCILDGPYTQDELEEHWDGPEEAEAYLLVKVEYQGEVQDVEWYFETTDEAYEWVKHFSRSIEPIVIHSGD